MQSIEASLTTFRFHGKKCLFVTDRTLQTYYLCPLGGSYLRHLGASCGLFQALPAKGHFSFWKWHGKPLLHFPIFKWKKASLVFKITSSVTAMWRQGTKKEPRHNSLLGERTQTQLTKENATASLALKLLLAKESDASCRKVYPDHPYSKPRKPPYLALEKGWDKFMDGLSWAKWIHT